MKRLVNNVKKYRIGKKCKHNQNIMDYDHNLIVVNNICRKMKPSKLKEIGIIVVSCVIKRHLGVGM